MSLPPDLAAGLVDRAASPDFARFEAQLRSSNYCAQPDPAAPATSRPATTAGERRRVWSTDGEPDGILRKACGNRREAVCPSCAERYRQDAYHLIGAGLRGGKGVPGLGRMEHPAVFATLHRTLASAWCIPSRRGADGRPLPCRPRRDAPGVPERRAAVLRPACMTTTIRAWASRCALECFDHAGAVLWNNALGKLWWLHDHLPSSASLAKACRDDAEGAAQSKVRLTSTSRSPSTSAVAWSTCTC